MDGTSLKGSIPSSGSSSSSDSVQKKTEDEARRWAVALNLAVLSGPTPLALKDESGPPATWRSMDSSLTRPDQALLAVGNPTTDSTEGLQGARLSLSVSTSELGEMSIVVDRGESGVRVVIGVEDSRAVSSMEPERAALERGLVSAGLTVESVSVTRLGTPFGTILARPRLQGTAERGSDTRPRKGAAGEAQSHNKNSRRLSLKG